MSHMPPLAVIILAAGKGTRMNSSLPKVMHKLAGLPMINWVLNTAEGLSPNKVIVVTGPDMDDLREASKPHETVIQEKQLGTGSALMTAMPALEGFKGDLLVLLGDTPFLSSKTLESLRQARHKQDGTDLSVLGVTLEDPTGYGRLLMDNEGFLKSIREEKDASDEEKQIKIVNTGAFCLDAEKTSAWLASLTNNNAQGEYYITDLPEIAAKDNSKTAIALVKNENEAKGCNTPYELSLLEKTAQDILRKKNIENGVILQDPCTVYFRYDTQIESGTIIEPSVYFGPEVTVGKNVHIKAFCYFEKCSISEDTTIGPFARIRPDTKIGENVRIGNFVEIKKSTIGKGSKISHLSYVGDTDMGADVNFGCGAITVNYDGFNKFTTKIEDGVMIGSNVNLVAPVTIEKGAFIAAGSTITKDVPKDALSLTRPEQHTIKDWAEKNRKKQSK
ncbi:MAG: bifunctional UDP-N-acetylglucosamine diphosphorylase/glucosamine-1-phosphate N-acetyltransferase GlmU [Alphaproteobacteria bacterium]|nr:bifunctional UDP-N-acetylglucosamine diphosphorylase/glucosamine-1-phosphate N-acetyltransferase GlmU [Alphaproteobacteria bacterium]